MQVIGNDMDDLFREAAENYPLKVTGADWNQVHAALMGNSDTPPPGNKKRSNNWRWLLLLLLIPFICNRFYHNNVNSPTAVQTQAIAGNTTVAVQPAVAIPNLNTDNTATTGIAVPPTTSSPGDVYAANPAAGNSSTSLTAIKNNAPATIKTKAKTRHTGKSRSRVKTSTTTATGDELAVTDETAVTEDTAGELPQTIPAQATNTVADTAKPMLTIKAPGNVKESKVAAETTTEKKQKAQQEKPADKKNFSSARLYVTLLGAKDASNVKAEKADRLGLGIGLSIGYNINRHLAIEAGALYSKKYYNADIKDFNNSKTQWPANRVITDLQGVCQVIELPVTVRYNFMLKSRSRFFAAAALNSYIMKQENYEYNYTTSTNPMQSEVYKTYRNTGQNWLSILQLSAGWQKNIGKIAALRVQPYYNIPLTGVGIGKVRISGAGLQAGISFVIK